jgi:hypothetical protein
MGFDLKRSWGRGKWSNLNLKKLAGQRVRHLAPEWGVALCMEANMSPRRPLEQISEPRRKEIFLALVEAQDRKMSVARSREAIAEQFGVDDEQIREIEREGLDNQWPPL